MKKLSEKYMGLRAYLEAVKPITAADDEYTPHEQAIVELYDNGVLLEQVVEAAKRAIAIIYDVGYAAIPTAIDLEEAIDRLEGTKPSRLGDNQTQEEYLAGMEAGKARGYDARDD